MVWGRKLLNKNKTNLTTATSLPPPPTLPKKTELIVIENKKYEFKKVTVE